MTVRELRAALTGMEANSDVQVVLFNNDGTNEVFDLEEVLSNHGHTQLEIYEAEPVREENPEGSHPWPTDHSRSRSQTARSMKPAA